MSFREKFCEMSNKCWELRNIVKWSFEHNHLTGGSHAKTCSEAEEASGFIRTLHHRTDTLPKSTETKDKYKHLRKALKVCSYPEWVFVNTETRAFRESRQTERRKTV